MHPQDHTTSPAAPITPAGTDIVSLNETREKVRNMLTRSASFRDLSPEERTKVAHDTVKVFHFLGDQAPAEMLGAAASAPPHRQDQAPARAMEDRIRQSDSTFRAEAAREGAHVAGALLKSVNFTDFVGGLIQNVYIAIVDASIKQMQAYGEMVASVAKSVDEFARDNITPNQGRDFVVDTFPDLFEISTDGDFFGEGKGEPRVAVKQGVDEDQAADRVARELKLDEKPRDLSSETLEQIIVPAAEMQLALSRQRLLATTLMMGLQKIVVTDGRISAKVMYNFRSQDTFSRNRRAVDYDYGDQRNISSKRDWDYGRDASEYEYSKDKDGAVSSTSKVGDRWSKGSYQYSNTPVIEMQEVVTDQSVGALEAAAQLAGSVDINFKTDVVNLDQLASTFQMNQIQDAAGMMGAARGSPGTAAVTPNDGQGQTQTQTGTGA
ncbi:hypothetical protein EI983_14080 [Roseovarius faecimaris]|uniref:Uncharacterized protein n=1 Tax=Roseovarius faecimaris TaxID=2494550 RepID=A0A6I6IUY0_9RHOB|nr:hypothetical protein [Roseovarius faecimaris]QGX99327.1 hypothetical protein EI983_14080 [Roseovarius faecimaris]